VRSRTVNWLHVLVRGTRAVQRRSLGHVFGQRETTDCEKLKNQRTTFIFDWAPIFQNFCYFFLFFF
jgi:hypothetical protein